MRDSWRHFAAEFIGTFALVFVGSGSIMTARLTGNVAAGLVAAALAHGLILAVMVSALMRISGHFNPAVTLGFLATRRIEPMMAALYIVAQVLGAVVAGYAL
jgi:aquaporin Z